MAVRSNSGLFAGMALLSLTTPALRAQGWTETVQLTKAAAAFGDRFGTSVAISGDTLVVGAPDDNNPSGQDAGIALLFERDQGGAGTWGKVISLKPSGAVAGERYGAAVAVVENTAVAGAPGSGRAVLFERDLGGPGAWGELAVLVDPAANPSSGFGSSLALHGDLLVIGAPYGDGVTAGTGVAHVYERRGGVWTHATALVARDGAVADLFGWSLAVEGNVVFVGAPGDDSAGVDSGSAYAFVRADSGAWSGGGKLPAGGARPLDRFGSSLAASAGLLVVGAPQPYTSPQAGTAHLFAFGPEPGAVHVEPMGRLAASDGSAFAEFGTSVAVHSGRVFVGAWLADGAAPGLADGAVYVFEPGPGPLGWSEEKLARDGAENGDGFGLSVGAFGDTAVVGAPYDGGPGSEIGSAHVFETP